MSLTANEEWREVADSPRYRVSSRGEVLGVRGHILRHEIIKGGYHRVKLHGNGGYRHRLVHVLVARAFIGPCPDGHEVNHRDGNKDDNSLANLEYATPGQNVRHSIDVLGVERAKGECNGWSKLTDEAVRDIRLRRAAGEAVPILATAYDVHECTVYRVLKGERWSHVKDAA